jgi:hypothetical protein
VQIASLYLEGKIKVWYRGFLFGGEDLVVGKNLVKDLYGIWQRRGRGREIQQTSARQNYGGICGEI